MSTTALLRWVHKETAGDITRSMNILRNFKAQRITNAPNAYRVLEERIKQFPGSTHFSFRPSGLIIVTKEAA